MTNKKFIKSSIACLLSLYILPFAGTANAFYVNEKNSSVWEGKKFTGWGKQEGFTTGDSYLNVDMKQGSQGTYWVWRIQKYYPELNQFCVSPKSGKCTITKSETVTETVTLAVDFGVNPSSAINPYGFSTKLNATKSLAKAITFTNSMDLTRGQNSYAYTIAMDKFIPSADIMGYWGNGRWCTSSEDGERVCNFTWSWGKSGTWSGHLLTGHRFGGCVTKKVLTGLKSGDGIPSGCPVPRVPSIVNMESLVN